MADYRRPYGYDKLEEEAVAIKAKRAALKQEGQDRREGTFDQKLEADKELKGTFQQGLEEKNRDYYRSRVLGFDKAEADMAREHAQNWRQIHQYGPEGGGFRDTPIYNQDKEYMGMAITRGTQQVGGPMGKAMGGAPEPAPGTPAARKALEDTRMQIDAQRTPTSIPWLAAGAGASLPRANTPQQDQSDAVGAAMRGDIPGTMPPAVRRPPTVFTTASPVATPMPLPVSGPGGFTTTEAQANRERVLNTVNTGGVIRMQGNEAPQVVPAPVAPVKKRRF